MGETNGEEPIPVLAGVAGREGARRARSARRVGIVLLGLVVLAACLGWFGPRDTTTSADGPGPALEVRHPQVVRAGLDTAVVVTVEPPIGGGPVVLEVETTMLERLGVEQYVPEPAEQAGRGDRVRLSYEAPASGPLVVTLAGRVPTQAVPGRVSYRVGVLGDGAVTHVDARTWVLP